MKEKVTVNQVLDTGFISGESFESRDIGKINLYHNPFPKSPCMPKQRGSEKLIL